MCHMQKSILKTIYKYKVPMSFELDMMKHSIVNLALPWFSVTIQLVQKRGRSQHTVYAEYAELESKLIIFAHRQKQVKITSVKTIRILAS